MLKLLVVLALSLTIILVACTGSEEEPAATSTPQATTQAPAPTPETTVMPTPAMTSTPASTPAATPEPPPPPTAMATATAMPTPKPTPEMTETPAPEPSKTEEATPEATPDGGNMMGRDGGGLMPLIDLNSNPPSLNVSEEEEACLVASLGTDAIQLLATSDTVSEEMSESALKCLEEDSILRLFLTPFLQATGELSAESSDCIRKGFGDIDYAQLLQSASMGEGETPADEASMMAGMTSFIVTLSCLDDDEFAKVAPVLGVSPDEREGFECAVEYLGGPEELAALVAPDAGPPLKLFEAVLACGVSLGGGGT